ncbi:RRP12-like protein [Condylostylus longicornis]|uniref:RRP12-like protein n=1 Tax=Condylostylus longicornis TaxID=2530218 RepID=UPI00244E0ACA|nr:RRP12-like protein [Condylostylus longicornis]
MGKFRTKLKRHEKGKTWKKGHSSTSNPENMKYRSRAKSRFFQANLNAGNEVNKPQGLTVEALMKHEAKLQYATGLQDPTVNEICGSIKSLSFDGSMQSESELGTFKTFQTFASSYSSCSNMSFKKLLNGFRSNSQSHKEMLAILTALTEIIKERGGKETSTEYFILLMETIEASTGDSETIAGISLLAMGIKSVPLPVLRKKFSETAKTLLDLLEHFMNGNNPAVIRQIIGCLSVLLRAQDFSTWSYSSTMRYLDAILSFTIYSKPKIRKAAQHAVVSIIHGSSFMIQPTTDQNSTNDSHAKIFHPGGGRVAKFCLNQFKPEVLATSETIVLHCLQLLKDTISGLKTEDAREICESVLSIMTTPNVLLRTSCFQVLHSLFSSRQTNLTGVLCGKLITAIFDYRPDKNDIRQTLAWLTVLKQGHIHMMNLDKNIGLSSLTKLVDICSSDLWMSDRQEIVAGASNCLKEVLYECVKPICSSTKFADINRHRITEIINLLGRALSSPFGDVAKYVILTFSILFEVVGENFTVELLPYVQALGKRYDSHNSLSVHIEHSIISAIKALGPENVLEAIPLTNAKGEVVLEKSWLLPLLREGINNASLKFFATYILEKAFDCNKKWKKFAEEGQKSPAHIHELLCCQLWGLLPGFCRNPKDPENFSLIAKTLGNAVVSNVEFRAPILDGICELIASPEEVNKELAKFAKNFLPRLFNVYSAKPSGSYEADLRKKTLETIKQFLTITNVTILEELFQTAFNQFIGLQGGAFESDSVLDLLVLLLIYQKEENIKLFYDDIIVPIMKNEKKKFIPKDEQKFKYQQRKSYEMLKNILAEERKNCKDFVKHNSTTIQKLLLDTLTTSCLICQASRLKCLKLLIETRKSLSTNDKLIAKTIPEAVVSFREFSTKQENISYELINLIGGKFKEADKLNYFVDIILAGFGGDQALISNTILALRTVIHSFSGNLTIKTIEFILDQVLVFLVQKSRLQAESGISFLITYIKVLQSPLIANHLEKIIKSLSSMVPDTKRYCRLQLGYLLRKLCKKFTADEIIKLVPGDDELTHRRLKKIRKTLSRESRQKSHEKDTAEQDSEEEPFVEGLEKRVLTIDDILAESETDSMDEDAENKKGKSSKKSNRNETFIQEDPEEIVDLADLKYMGNILSNAPKLNDKNQKKEKKKDSNRGFKTAEDGRLIITDNPSDSNESDSEDNDMEIEGVDKAKGKSFMQNDSSDEEETITKSNRKRKATESMKSGYSNLSKYTAGGKGIHRKLDSLSTKSGYSRTSTTTAKSTIRQPKIKKLKSDTKNKSKLDPYTYIPLSRNLLNKRNKKKHSGQFKSIVKGSRKTIMKKKVKRMK